MNEAFCTAAITAAGKVRGFTMNATETKTDLGPKCVAFLRDRGLDAKVAETYGVYTGRAVGEGKVVPDRNGDIIVFPYLEKGVTVAEKYRTPDKRFWQRSNGRRTFWNSDVLDDPTLEAGTHPLIITEGEPDALAAICSGYRFVVSVPNGAPPPGNSKTVDPGDGANEATGRFAYVWNNRDRLKRVKRFTLAVDNDAAGEQLRQELLRRLSPARCSFVQYPDGCKDLNDVLIKHGPDGVRAVLASAGAPPALPGWQ
jgi:twinkle protein